MLCLRQIVLSLIVLCMSAMVLSRPDSAGIKPLPGPGISYGGIPYGSKSGEVAQFYKQATSGGRRANLAASSDVDFAPIEQWL